MFFVNIKYRQKRNRSGKKKETNIYVKKRIVNIVEFNIHVHIDEFTNYRWNLCSLLKLLQIIIINMCIHQDLEQLAW